MSDLYHQYLSSMAGVGGQPNLGPTEPPPPMPPPPQQQQLQAPAMPMGGPPLSHNYSNMTYFTGFHEPIMFNAPKAQRGRRKSAPGLDHVKHRRTRSGCYTCRSRRVKCDESHPICERCRKGKRECVYPEPPAPKGSGGQGSRDASSTSQQASPTSSHGDEDDDNDQDSKLDPIPDEEEDEPESATSTVAPRFPPRRSSTTSSFGLQRSLGGTRQGSETPSFDGNKSSSPSVSTGTATSLPPGPLTMSEFVFPAPGTRPDFSFLPRDLQFYMNYYCDNLTHYHYCIVNDQDDFFGAILTSIAVHDEMLLNAVASFAAYHHALRDPNGNLSEFLQYYQRSVSLMMVLIAKNEKTNIATLLTILQLATIEEYLGDWLNLMGHQSAAWEILPLLFTPQSIMQTPLGRMVLTWYARFDVFTAIMGSHRTVLPREWFTTAIAFYQSQIAADPGNIAWRIEEWAARLRLISVEMSYLTEKGAKRELTGDEYLTQHMRIAQALRDWRETMDPALRDPAYQVVELPNEAARHDSPDEIVYPFEPGVLFAPPLFATSILMCEWHSISLMHSTQKLEGTDSVTPDEMTHALSICQIGEAVERWPMSPAGSLIILQACLAAAALCIPRDPQHVMFIRRKLALLEIMGYIAPLTVRRRMAATFEEPSLIRWWLPNDEGFSPFLQTLRAFADERNETAVSAQSINLREIRHVFSRMRLGQEARAAQKRDAGSTGGGGKNVAA